MSTVTMEVPDDLLIALREQPTEFAHEARFVTALHYLQEKRLSLGQAARLAGMNRLDFMDALAARGLPAFDLSADAAAEEAAAGGRS